MVALRRRQVHCEEFFLNTKIRKLLTMERHGNFGKANLSTSICTFENSVGCEVEISGSAESDQSRVHLSDRVEIPDIENEDSRCFADKISMACVWRESDFNLDLVNQIFHDMQLKDPFAEPTEDSQLFLCVSSSFPAESRFSFEDEDNHQLLISSTPLNNAKRAKRARLSLNGKDESSSKAAELQNQDVSPIFNNSRQRRYYLTKRKLKMAAEKFDAEERLLDEQFERQRQLVTDLDDSSL